MKFENIRIMNFENAIRGMRNPKNSWHLSDSYFGLAFNDPEEILRLTNDQPYEILYKSNDVCEFASIGPKDMELAKRLINGGSEHRKFLRQIFISVDITAPLYIWKEFDTYKVGTVANSTSTMHTIEKKPIILDCFETDDYFPISADGTNFVEKSLIPYLEHLRNYYLTLKNMGDNENAYKAWKELIRWLPESWLQTRTVTMNYENAFTMYHQREFHKLNEWSGKRKTELNNMVNMIENLPYMKDFLSLPTKEE